MDLYCGSLRLVFANRNPLCIDELHSVISQRLGLTLDKYYLLANGRKITDGIASGNIHVVTRTLGGKGGFGSMLRAIGAQIEKTTNREACRDLSGRRLRDINEEQRLKKWVAQQAEREKEAQERKKKKLEKLLEQPKYEFNDEEYDKERSSLPEKVEDAVLKGLEASCSTKRKPTENNTKVPKKKPKLWIDNELDEDLSSSGSESEDENEARKSSSDVEHLESDSPDHTRAEISGKSDEKVKSSSQKLSDVVKDEPSSSATEKAEPDINLVQDKSDTSVN